MFKACLIVETVVRGQQNGKQFSWLQWNQDHNLGSNSKHHNMEWISAAKQLQLDPYCCNRGDSCVYFFLMLYNPETDIFVFTQFYAFIWL